jgi:endo-1,3-1,4-beta-glycanase ExoK
MKTRLLAVLALFVSIILLTLLMPIETLTRFFEANVSTCSPALLDNMNDYNTALWHKADGWWNGLPFWNGWRADHVEFSSGIMSLRLDDQPCPSGCSGQPYASGEYRTNNFYRFGRVEGRFKAAKGDGVVSSLFIYTGSSDGNPHDEIDIEILGKDTTKMQVNYFTNGVGGHETLIDLGFDASFDFHTYAFEWSPTTIKWYVDGNLVHTEDGSSGPLPTTPGRIMMNLWPGTGVDDWLGPFTYTTPIYAYYDWIKYAPLECVYLPLIFKSP